MVDHPPPRSSRPDVLPAHPAPAEAGAEQQELLSRRGGGRRGHDHGAASTATSPPWRATSIWLEIAEGVEIRIAKAAVARGGSTPGADDGADADDRAATAAGVERERHGARARPTTRPPRSRRRPRRPSSADRMNARGPSSSRSSASSRWPIVGLVAHVRRRQHARSWASTSRAARRSCSSPRARSDSDAPRHRRSTSSATGSTASAWPSRRSPARATPSS